MSIQSNCFPMDWKLANVVPVFKKGDTEFIENYRPISLLSTISKVFERCVLTKIRNHLIRYMQPTQHGFLPGKSCTSQLVQVMDLIGQQLDAGQQTDIVYLDMSKAFDKVVHSILLERLREINIQGKLNAWFASYLLGREQRVTIPGATSSILPVTSGVPQGSVLGPVLFLIYVNNIPDVILKSNLACFADDTKLFKTIFTPTDAQDLQNDVVSLNHWSTNSGLSFNEDKTKFQRITRKKLPVTYHYTMNNKTIEKIDNERDLGVLVSSDLTWSKQALKQTTTANKMLGVMHRSIAQVSDVNVRRTMYLAVVRPHVGYATQVWSPQSTDLIRRIERVQRRGTKVILNLPFRTEITYTQRLLTLNLLPISYWHEYLDIMFFFKAVNNLVIIDPSILPTPHVPRRKTRASASPDVLCFRPRKCRTATYQRSFFVRVCRIWNVLPLPLRMSDVPFAKFKRELKVYYHTAVALNYDVEEPRSWKTICLNCNQSRDLSKQLVCCR